MYYTIRLLHIGGKGNRRGAQARKNLGEISLTSVKRTRQKKIALIGKARNVATFLCRAGRVLNVSPGNSCEEGKGFVCFAFHFDLPASSQLIDMAASCVMVALSVITSMSQPQPAVYDSTVTPYISCSKQTYIHFLIHHVLLSIG